MSCYSDESGEGIMAECEAGTLVPGQEMTLDCEANGWGSGCITRLYRKWEEGELEQLWLRTCLGVDMTCEQGVVEMETGVELWTHCCDDGDNCNNIDPRDVIEPPSNSLSCMSCLSSGTGEEGEAECVAGELLAENTIECGIQGWTNECIT